MFGVSYSQGSVMRAGAAFKVLDDTFDFQLKKFPVEGLPDISEIQLDNFSDAFFNPELKAKATVRLLQHGYARLVQELTLPFSSFPCSSINII